MYTILLPHSRGDHLNRGTGTLLVACSTLPESLGAPCQPVLSSTVPGRRRMSLSERSVEKKEKNTCCFEVVRVRRPPARWARCDATRHCPASHCCLAHPCHLRQLLPRRVHHRQRRVHHRQRRVHLTLTLASDECTIASDNRAVPPFPAIALHAKGHQARFAGVRCATAGAAPLRWSMVMRLRCDYMASPAALRRASGVLGGVGLGRSRLHNRP